MALLRVIAAGGVILSAAGPAPWHLAAAQQAQMSQAATPERFQTPFVTVDQERLFLQSAFGQDLQQELETARADLSAENRRIEAELIAEERDLTDRRADLDPASFTELAEAFDAKVQLFRLQQDRKSAMLQERLDDARQTFLNEIGPVLVELLRERGAVAILDRNAVLLAFEGLDITEDALALIDRRLDDTVATDGQSTEPRDRPADAVGQPADPADPQ
jgi:Skp family chaperone for outer membrane proteins